ncbi:MAG: hypothetical protein IT385_21865 [Deltaproteobacteria bacterium]|nr:hypothetical protein [Deltaproteobacteria bacterium]
MAGLGAAGGVGCGDDGGDDGPCDPVANRGCSGGKVCEPAVEGDPICAAPLVVRGEVFDLDGGEPIVGARVVALDPNRAPVSAVATSDALGDYTLRVPATRNADGSVVGVDVTLRVDAAGYQAFPGPIRQALPIATGSAVMDDGELVVASALTTIGLLALPPGAGAGVIRGTADVPASRVGVLVVAEPSAGGAGATAIADRDGAFVLFNLSDGDYDVAAYARGVSYAPGAATLTAADRDAEVELDLDPGRATSTVTGNINFANAPVGTGTSVILVVESTFHASTLRGESPPGLRVAVPKASPAFTIEGVPEGRYVVLAGFENDLLVRDPDRTQGGTDIVHVTVVGGDDLALATSFKVTDALATFGPGADGPEAVTAAPVLRFEDDAGEDHFVVEVHDAFGALVWSKEIDKHTSDDPEVPYEGPLEPGMFYQFRAVSYDADDVPLSTTEDLRGVFYYVPAAE